MNCGIIFLTFLHLGRLGEDFLNPSFVKNLNYNCSSGSVHHI